MNYVERFEKMGFGLFVHFGLYSVWKCGEWGYRYLNDEQKKEYVNETPKRFFVKEGWAKELVKTAKETGCKYITLTTRHHDGCSLYDTCGLNKYDAPHSACGRDLIREFVDACNEEEIMPMLYHTLLNWQEDRLYSTIRKYQPEAMIINNTGMQEKCVRR